MSRSQALRALVNERLAAAAEEICVLFERTIAEYEEELRRSNEENQRELSPRIEVTLENSHSPSTSPDRALNQEIQEPEEQRIKQEEEQMPVAVPEFSAVFVKTEESSLPQKRQTEQRQKTQREDISSEPHLHFEIEGHSEHSSDTDNDDNWEPSRCSAAQMDTEADGHQNKQVQTKDRSTGLFPPNTSAPETTAHNEDMSESGWRKQHCSVHKRKFASKKILNQSPAIESFDTAKYVEDNYVQTECTTTGLDSEGVQRQKQRIWQNTMHMESEEEPDTHCTKRFVNQAYMNYPDLEGISYDELESNYTANVADALINVGKQADLNSRKRGRPSWEDAPGLHRAAPRAPPLQRIVAPPVDVILDRVDHFPIHAEKRGRCRLCKNGYTQMACLKCKVLLCFTKDKNCFLAYHTKN